MKKMLYVLMIIPLLFACDKKKGVYTINITENKTVPITSTIWQKADSSRFYYDLRVTESYYTFLDDKSDTLIRIYKPDNPDILHNQYIKSRNILDSRLQFLKHNSRNLLKNNQLWIVEHNNSIKSLTPENSPKQILSSAVSYPFTNLPNSTDYSLTADEIYATPLSSTYPSPYYFYHPDSGYFRAEIYKHPDINYPKVSLAYLTCLTVNDKKKRVVSAQRFINDVLFYDLSGNIHTVITFGDEHIVPEIKDKQVDMKNSTKCFLYICGAKDHVYCLYDGSTDYTAKSKILVFDWNGKHIKTYQADRQLKQIAINEAENKIIALAANEQYGRDVVEYKLK